MGSPKNPKAPPLTTTGPDQAMALNKSGSDFTLDPYVPSLTTSEPEQAMALDRSGSDIVTMRPFDPLSGTPDNRSGSDTVVKRTSQKAKKKRRANEKMQMNINALVGPQSDTWTKFFALNFEEPKNDELPLSNMKIWVEIKKLLQNSEFSCVRRSDGSVLVDAKTERNAKILSNTNKLCNTGVTTSRDVRMNSARGIVFVPRTEYMTPCEIEPMIKEQAEDLGIPVSEVSVFTKPSRSSGQQNYYAKITFESRTLPAYMTVGFEKMKILEDLPKPRQCQQCWKYGHKKEWCKGSPCCPICGAADHLLMDCLHKGDHNYVGHCINCGKDGHTAFARGCPVYKKEREVLITMTRKGISKAAARRLLEEAGLFTGVSYAKRVTPDNISKPVQLDKQHQSVQQGRAQLQKQAEQPHEEKKNQRPEEESNQQQTEVQSTQQQVEAEAQQGSPEDLLQTIFGDHVDPFLSMEAETMESQSAEEPMSQVFPRRNTASETGTKRKPGEAFQQSPTGAPLAKKAPQEGHNDQSDPVSTSSPKREKQREDPNPPSPMSRVQRLDKMQGAVPKNYQTKKKTTQMKTDGQHTNKPDCGCHTCITELAVIKNEPKELDQKYSKQFKKDVRRRKIHNKKPMANHPEACKCKSHLEKSWDSSANSEPQGEQRELSSTRVEDIWKKFYTTGRTKTKHPSTIPVHTSR